MAVDFKKLREAKKQPRVIDPLEIFRRLPKKGQIKDLYGSQVEVLQAWFANRGRQDHVVKLHTGGGKTLVGLLIAQSILNETREPVIFICPNNQLLGQALDKASEYSLPAVPYEKPFPDQFLNGKSVMVANYSALFNGMSRFGVRGRDILRLGGVIVDDAHVGSNIVRDQFTIRVKRNLEDTQDEAYQELAAMFRRAFKELGQLGTYDDIVGGSDYGVIEVPYWAWQEKLEEVQAFLRERVEGRYELQWPLLRDNLKYCHCLITKSAVVITPILPLVDLIPSFSECKRRVFMSATIPDDSEIIRTFDSSAEALFKPLTSNSLAGVSERMILVPELMGFQFTDVHATTRKVCQNAAKAKFSTVILVPSGHAAQTWREVAEYPDSPEAVEAMLKRLIDGTSHGPIVLANRYDGIDLPDESCRLLVLSGLPRAAGEYEIYRANVFAGAASLNRAIAQKIEQGMGRAARGPGDYCVVIVIGKDLVAWLGKDANLRFLTTSTFSQLEIGVEISKNMSESKELVQTINRCLFREKDWVGYHAETLADLTIKVAIEKEAVERAAAERQALRLWRDSYHEKAISKLTDKAESQTLEVAERGWLLQFAGRIAFDWGKKDHALELQQRAFSENRNLFRPATSTPSVVIILPGAQAQAIVKRLKPFRFKRGYIAEFLDLVSVLVPDSSSNQFESAMSELGATLGFETSRPEKAYGEGPDLLWIISKGTGLIMEAKSRKNKANALTKAQHGQLLVAENWFKDKYPKLNGIRVSVHPSVTATKKSVPTRTKALTLARLNELISETRKLVTSLCESGHPDSELASYCEDLLKGSNLTPDRLVEHYLVDFEVQEID